MNFIFTDQEAYLIFYGSIFLVVARLIILPLLAGLAMVARYRL
jgi:hypothetical protein